FDTKSIGYNEILILSCIKCCIKSPFKRAFFVSEVSVFPVVFLIKVWFVTLASVLNSPQTI
ncbi:hypothetical protein QDZ26_004888, partial [Pluralibacter gergoviae]